MQQPSNWEPVGSIPPKSLNSARIQLHWAAQVLAAAADAVLEHAEDDSHTNLHWDATTDGLVTLPLQSAGDERTFALSFSNFALLHLVKKGEAARFPLAGESLQSALKWAADQLGHNGELATRGYDMPRHDGSFAPPTEAFGELGRYFASATAVLSALAASDTRATSVAVWPHHFDLGGILFLEKSNPKDAAQIGFGLSPGDASIEEPYFYLTPFPLAEHPKLPPLASGTWHTEGFTAAVLKASELAAVATSDQKAHVESYLRSAISQGELLIAAA